jgi:CheY-like chemotaxis protein
VLWVDDMPSNNTTERRFLRAAGVTVVNAVSTADALAELARDDFDIVITDQRRPESPQAGTELARQVTKDYPGIIVIGYVSVQPPTTPDGFLGVTTRPGTLLQLVLDAARQRG